MLKWVRVRERLLSSARYGRYWDVHFPRANPNSELEEDKLYEEFRKLLNNSPYNPVLDFVIPEGYVIDTKTRTEIASDFAYSIKYSKLPWITPVIVESPRECPTIKDGVCRVIAFDLTRAIPTRRLKAILIDKIIDEMKKGEIITEEQGNLTVKYACPEEYPSEALYFIERDPFKLTIKYVKGLSVMERVFNHTIIIENPKYDTIALCVNSVMYKAFIFYRPTRVAIVSRDHDMISLNASAVSFLICSHPIPQAVED